MSKGRNPQMFDTEIAGVYQGCSIGWHCRSASSTVAERTVKKLLFLRKDFDLHLLIGAFVENTDVVT